jgi:hypothetical protein
MHAEGGDVVYIDETALIDLTNVSEGVTIPAGVTLASNRGERNWTGSAEYSFYIDKQGEYIVWSLASTGNEDDGSVWVVLDDEYVHEWNLDPGSGWRWSRDESYELSSGWHTLTLKGRGDGLQLDGILMTDETDYEPDAATEPKNGGRYLWIEAESGKLIPPMKKFADSSASGGTFISVPEGTGSTASPISPGGRIYVGMTTSDGPAAIIAGGEDVRITGIRLEGPDTTTDDVDRPAYGIFSTSRNLEVDNCELSGWSGAAVNIYRTGGSDMKTGGYIHHNFIHHCQMDGLGYGVVVNEGAVCLIEANFFDYCRHAIAGDGRAGGGYEARYNICGPNFPAIYAHNFDMHGKPDPSGSGTIAGDTIHIHHNSFMATGPETSFPVFIQGVPRKGAYIHHNLFLYTQSEPVWQSNGRGNVHVMNNLIGPEEELVENGPVYYM